MSPIISARALGHPADGLSSAGGRACHVSGGTSPFQGRRHTVLNDATGHAGMAAFAVGSLWRRPAWLFGRRGGDRMPAQAMYTLAVFAAAIVIMWLIGRSRPR